MPFAHDSIFRTYQTFPYLVTDKDGNEVPKKLVLSWLEEMVDAVHDLYSSFLTLEWLRKYADYVDNDYRCVNPLTGELFNKTTVPSVVGRRLGIKLSEEQKKQFSNASRVEMIMQGMAISALSSWHEIGQDKIREKEKKLGRKLSQQEKTAVILRNKPQNDKRYMVTSYADRQLVSVEERNGGDDYSSLVLTIKTSRGIFHLHFPCDDSRVLPSKTKILTPTISYHGNHLVFGFPVRYPKPDCPLNTHYCVSVDVGVRNPAIWSLVHEKDGVVNTFDMSLSSRQLWASARRASNQGKRLRSKGEKEESLFHSGAASRKKKKLAELIAQEIVDTAYTYYCPIVVEELSHMKNTADGGKWFRGLIVRHIEECAEKVGIPVIRANPAFTSQICSCCGEVGYVTKPGKMYGWFVCGNPDCAHHHEVQDRDVNATGNIATNGRARKKWNYINHKKKGKRGTKPKKTVATRKGSPFTPKKGKPTHAQVKTKLDYKKHQETVARIKTKTHGSGAQKTGRAVPPDVDNSHDLRQPVLPPQNTSEEQTTNTS